MAVLRKDALLAAEEEVAELRTNADAALVSVGVEKTYGVDFQGSYEEDDHVVFIYSDSDLNLAIPVPVAEGNDKVWLVHMVDGRWTRIAPVHSLSDIGRAIIEKGL